MSARNLRSCPAVSIFVTGELIFDFPYKLEVVPHLSGAQFCVQITHPTGSAKLSSGGVSGCFVNSAGHHVRRRYFSLKDCIAHFLS
jgi:hypothetical protein